jgi:hypothetical protein
MTSDVDDDALEPAKGLLRLLDAKKRKSTDAGALTWVIGQKRPAEGGAKGSSEASEWVLVGKYATKKDARAAARRRSNGMKFLAWSNAGNHSYYKCASHEDRGCLCVARVPRPTHRRAAPSATGPSKGGAVRRARRTRRFGARKSASSVDDEESTPI